MRHASDGESAIPGVPQLRQRDARAIWQGVAAVTRARISIAKGRLLCEQTRELRVQAQDARNRVHALGVRAAYSVERAHLAAEWVALVAARPRLRAVGSVPRSTASVGPTRRF